MRVSLNTIKQFMQVDISVEDLVKKINEQIGQVEEVIDLADKYKDALIVSVVGCDKHDNADKLSICKIDDGGATQDIERDENGHIQVVCGAPNARAGILAVWLPPASTVPASYDDKEPFVLSVRDIRGIKSNGMLAAADELAIGTDHSGIIEIDADEWRPNDIEIKPGVSFAKAYGLDDTIIDIENKMFTHRPDCFGQLGVAREIAGITGQQFTSPDWYKTAPQFGDGEGLELYVENNAQAAVPRFMAVAVKDVAVKPSPLWLRCELVCLGAKPINNIVDVTNYIMLLTAQPVHAYDYDKLRGHKLGTRFANAGEKLPLLNGKAYELDETDIVIVDGEGPVGLAGVMGGGNSEVSPETKNIVLEVATFDMYAVRKTSMRHGLFTDAVTRFNKGQSPLQNQYVLDLLMQSVADTAGGQQASKVFDINDGNYAASTVEITPDFINQRLGLQITSNDVVRLLGNVEFTIESGDVLKVTPPFWRTDIEQAEDIVEEVGRLYGFDKLQRELPTRSSKPVPKNAARVVKQKIRTSLLRAGANEVLTYSFVHQNVMARAEQDATQAFKLTNALSPDLQYYRLSVLPSLLDKVHANIKAGHDEFVLFEIGKGHNAKDHLSDDDGLPRELEFVDGIYSSKKAKDGAAYFQMRRLVRQLAKDLGFTLKLDPISQSMDYPVTAPFDLSRSALVTSRQGEFIGMIGELKQSVINNFKLPAYSAAMSLDLQGIIKATNVQRVAYSPLSKYPSISQDISLKTRVDVSYEQLFHTAWSTVAENGTEIDATIRPLGIYQPEGEPETKTTTLRIEFVSMHKTLTDDDIAPVMQKIADTAAAQFGAERI